MSAFFVAATGELRATSSDSACYRLAVGVAAASACRCFRPALAEGARARSRWSWFRDRYRRRRRCPMSCHRLPLCARRHHDRLAAARCSAPSHSDDSDPAYRSDCPSSPRRQPPPLPSVTRPWLRRFDRSDKPCALPDIWCSAPHVPMCRPGSRQMRVPTMPVQTCGRDGVPAADGNESAYDLL